MAAAPAPVSYAALTQVDTKKQPLRVVQLEGHALLKIAKHCKEHASGSSVVTGQLLGLDVGQTLQVTDCFPFPGNVGEEEADNAVEGESYQLEMMRCLRETNADNNMVGWYQSAAGGSYQVVEIIETFVNYMENLERCICITYDSGAADAGGVGVRAMRLSESFVSAYRGGALTVDRVRTANLSWRDVFVEIPISIHNSALAAALMAAVASPAPALSAQDCERLSLGAAPVLERDLDCLSDCLDDVMTEQGKLSGYHGALRRQQAAAAQYRLHRRQENASRRAAGEEPLPEEPPEGMFKPPPEPLQLDALLLGNQMTTYCAHLGATATQALDKISLLEALQRSRAD